MTEIDRNKLRALAMAAVEAYDCWLDSNSNKNPPDETIQIDGTTMLALLDQIDEAEKANQICQSIIEHKRKDIAALEARNKRMEEALLKISSPSQTTDLLWWQIEAREALESKP